MCVAEDHLDLVEHWTNLLTGCNMTANSPNYYHHYPSTAASVPKHYRHPQASFRFHMRDKLRDLSPTGCKHSTTNYIVLPYTGTLHPCPLKRLTSSTNARVLGYAYVALESPTGKNGGRSSLHDLGILSPIQQCHHIFDHNVAGEQPIS